MKQSTRKFGKRNGKLNKCHPISKRIKGRGKDEELAAAAPATAAEPVPKSERIPALLLFLKSCLLLYAKYSNVRKISESATPAQILEAINRHLRKTHVCDRKTNPLVLTPEYLTKLDDEIMNMRDNMRPVSELCCIHLNMYDYIEALDDDMSEGALSLYPDDSIIQPYYPHVQAYFDKEDEDGVEYGRNVDRINSLPESELTNDDKIFINGYRRLRGLPLFAVNK